MSMIEYIRDTDGTLLGTVCVTTPLDDEKRQTFAELFRFVRDKAQREDPDNLHADKQRLTLDRLHKRLTPACDRRLHRDQLTRCERPEGHAGRHKKGDLRWEEREAVRGRVPDG